MAQGGNHTALKTDTQLASGRARIEVRVSDANTHMRTTLQVKSSLWMLEQGQGRCQTLRGSCQASWNKLLSR